MTRRSLAASLALLGLSAAPLLGQQTSSRFRVTPAIGVMRFDRTSALSSTETGLSKLWASAGLEASYAVNDALRVGLYLEYQRPTTSPDYFPYALFRTGNNYNLYAVSQVVSVLSYGVDGAYTLPIAPRLAPYIRAGIGQHAVYPDVQATNSTNQVTGTHFLLGGGVNYAVSSTIGLRFELLDFMWNDWNREDLNPVTPAYQNTTFPEDNPDGINWDKPSIIHNLRLALGVSFTPTGGSAR